MCQFFQKFIIDVDFNGLLKLKGKLTLNIKDASTPATAPIDATAIMPHKSNMGELFELLGELFELPDELFELQFLWDEDICVEMIIDATNQKQLA